MCLSEIAGRVFKRYDAFCQWESAGAWFWTDYLPLEEVPLATALAAEVTTSAAAKLIVLPARSTAKAMLTMILKSVMLSIFVWIGWDEIEVVF